MTARELPADNVRVRPVAVSDWPDAHLVEFVVGNQTFPIADYWETKDEADIYADLFRHALAAHTRGGVSEGMVSFGKEFFRELRLAVEAWGRDGELRYGTKDGNFHLVLGQNHYKAGLLADKIDELEAALAQGVGECRG